MHTYFCSLKVDEDMVILMYGVRVGVRLRPSSLKVLATDEAAIDVDV